MQPLESPPPHDLVVHADRALVDGALHPVVVVVDDGRVSALLEPTAAPAGRTVLRLADDEVLLPGLVDTHVHVNEPGRTEWEGFASATRAAAAGGVTTVVDMPLNSLPPTTSPEALEVKRAAARAAGPVVDVAFWGGAVPANTRGDGSLRRLLEAGVLGVKSFLQDSGVPEFPPLDADALHRAASELAGARGLLLVHAEDPAVLAAAPAPQGRSYAAFEASRPPEAEAVAVRRVVDVVAATGCRAHAVHLSSAAGVAVVREARAAGLPVSAETCPHYLALAGSVPDGAPQHKCCPPVRGPADADALWQALTDGVLDVVVSDHSPSTPELKELASGDLDAAWGGISSLEVAARVVWTAARERGIGLVDVVRWTSQGPADLVGLGGKGRIAVGADADLLVLAPDAEVRVDARRLHHRHPVTPYDGARLRGQVRRVLLAGVEIDAERPHGRLLGPGGTGVTA
ncbi:allantoinase AllB [Pseudokineococcus sp. 1T1Z-3]|uniref:allantoinase AllB n=1 Tax=Pseudokineococcus sp. 1T1Z-3 TaxID=3132745 RepID=UPI0030AF3447